MEAEIDSSYTHHRVCSFAAAPRSIEATVSLCHKASAGAPSTSAEAALPDKASALEDGRQRPSTRQRRKRKASPSTQQYLDDKFPGNARNRAIIQHLEATLPAFTAWRAAHGLPTPVPHDTSVGVSPPTTTTTPNAPLATAQALACEAAAPPPNHQAIAPSPSSPHATDWVALEALAQVVHPKLCVLPSPLADPHAAPLGSPPLAVAGNLFHAVVENSSGVDVVALAHDTAVVLPPFCRFLMSDVDRLRPLLTGGRRHSLIVVDPPWENRSVLRGAQYATLPANRLLSLPVAQLLDQEHGLVALWVTNRERLRLFVEGQLLAAWGLRCVATWYWLKVDAHSGQPTLPLAGMHRHPYEQLLLCRPLQGGATHVATQAPCSSISDGGDGVSAGVSQVAALRAAAAATPLADTPAPLGPHSLPAAALPPASTPRVSAAAPQQVSVPRAAQAQRPIPDGFVIFCTPGAHSRKPHLGRLLAPFLGPPDGGRAGGGGAGGDAGGHGGGSGSSRGGVAGIRGGDGDGNSRGGGSSSSSGELSGPLELFARELHAGWTSWGNQVLLFQDAAAFERITPAPALP